MNEARVYADGFERSFAEVKDLLEFLAERGRNAKWIRKPTNTLRLAPLEKEAQNLDAADASNSEYDMLLEEADIDSIIKGKTQYYEEAVVQAVETMVQNFVTDLLNSIRERGIDTKSTYTVFIGGGAVLLERFLEQADRLGKHTFIRDMKANADGYDLLYRMTQAGV